MLAAVQTEIHALRAGLPDAEIETKDDGEGGAFVVVRDVPLGYSFEPSRSWIGFHITHACPDADIYPHFIDAAVKYVGGAETPNAHPDGDLPIAMTRGATMPGFELSAIQISRQSRRRNADTDSALRKLVRVLGRLEAA